MDRVISETNKAIGELGSIANDAADALEAMDTIHAALGSGKWQMRFDPAGEMTSCTWSDTFRKMVGVQLRGGFP